MPEVVSSLAGATRMPHVQFLAGNLIGSLSVGFAYGALSSIGNIPAMVLFSISVIVPLCCLAVFMLFLAKTLDSARRNERCEPRTGRHPSFHVFAFLIFSFLEISECHMVGSVSVRFVGSSSFIQSSVEIWLVGN